MSSDSEDPQGVPSGRTAPKASLRVCYVYRTPSFRKWIENHESLQDYKSASCWVEITTDTQWKDVAKEIEEACCGRIKVIIGRVLDCLGKRSILPTVIVVEEEACFVGKGNPQDWVRRTRNKMWAWMVIVAAVKRERNDIPRAEHAHAVIRSLFKADDLLNAVEKVRSDIRKSWWGKILMVVEKVISWFPGGKS